MSGQVRLSGQAAFRKIFAQGKKIKGEWLTLYLLPNGLSYSRFGSAVRRKVAPTAVSRNRLKRWLRESFRHNQAEIRFGLDIVVVIQRYPKPASYQEVDKLLCKLLKAKDLQQ